jgi:hypothetical protein
LNEWQFPIDKSQLGAFESWVGACVCRSNWICSAGSLSEAGLNIGIARDHF